MYDLINFFLKIPLLICIFCLPAHSVQIQLSRVQPGALNNPIKDLPDLSHTTRIFGEATPIKNFKQEPSVLGELRKRYGCDNCDIKMQFKAQDIQWPTLFFGSRIELVPSADKKQFQVPADFPILSDGVANPRNITLSYDNTYAKAHEVDHADHQFNFFERIFSRLSVWSKNYQPGWFNNPERPAQALLEDFRKNIELAMKEYEAEYKIIANKYHNDLLPSMPGSSVLLGPETKGSAVSGTDVDGRPLPWARAFILDNETGEWSLVFKDGDDSWRKDTTNLINAYKVQWEPQTTGDDPEISCVPAPLPILGVGVVFRYTRMLRRMSKKRLLLMSNQIHYDRVRTSPFT